MSMVAPYPHVEIDVEDKSIYIPVNEDILPLHRPLYIMRTQKGPVGVPVWCESYTRAKKIFGSNTFNQRSKYFSPASYFLLQQLQSNGAFIMRAGDDTADSARVFVELGVKAVDAVPQYKRDAYGKFVYDEEGKKIALESATATAGYQLIWRAVSTPADINSIDPGAWEDLGPAQDPNDSKITWYPMFSFLASNAGAWGNAFGFKLCFSNKDNSGDFIVRNGSVAYQVAPVELEEGNSTPTVIYDKYNNPAVSGVVKPDTIDSISGVDISFNKKLAASYSDGYELPLSIYYYSDSFKTVGDLIMKAEVAAKDAIVSNYGNIVDVDGRVGVDGTVVTFVEDLLGVTIGEGDVTADSIAADIDGDDAAFGFMANIMTCVDRDKRGYFASYVVATSDADAPAGCIDMDADATIYMMGGTDGNDSDPYIEEYTRKYLTAAANNNHEYLIDYFRMPFNCVIDSGWSIATKKAYLEFMDVRDDLKVYLGTQQSWMINSVGKLVRPPVNTKYEDESIGAGLRTHAWLMRESIAKGTECCRATIFLHAGRTADYDVWLPGTLWIAKKLAEYCNRDFMNKEPKELPNSAVECWKDLSWVASSEDTKSRNWNAGLNYVQYYSMTGLHYASVRSVYKYDTSVLVDDMFVNAITWMKHIVRRSWARFAGATRPVAELQQAITEDLTSRLAYMINGKYEFTVDVYQTDEDKKLGYVQHVDITVTSPATNRVWLVNIICKREGFEPEA